MHPRRMKQAYFCPPWNDFPVEKIIFRVDERIIPTVQRCREMGDVSDVPRNTGRMRCQVGVLGGHAEGCVGPEKI